MRQDLARKVVVITGASSGIGRAAAHRFAERGCRLVLAARREERLDEVVAECEERGGTAISAVVDVADEAAVDHLANVAIRHYRGIDVWINNAGIMMLGPFWKTPAADFRRLIETNLFGVVNGARAVLPHFLRRGRGILINTASIVGHVGQPDSTAYVASKFAVRGFSIALREDLTDHPDIHVCMVSPSSTDTPLWQHTANYTGRAFEAFRPVYDANDVAAAMVSLAERPRREVVVGTMGKVTVQQHRLIPELTERQMAEMTRARIYRDAPASPDAGALWRPANDRLRVSGGWQPARATKRRRGLFAGAAVAAIPLAIALLAPRALAR
jgi:short-subunit dehydrogenase